MKYILCFMRLLLVGGILLGWYAAVSVPVYALRTDDVTADAAVVLGAAAWGSRPSPVYRERLNHAIALYQQGKVERLIFTGGVGIKSTQSEAEIGRQYALGRGVPDSAILLEPQSTSTIENLTNVRQLAAENDLHTFLIVSTPSHMKRAMLIAKRLGLDAYTSPTRSTLWLRNGTRQQLYVREVLGYAHHLLLFW